MELFLLFLDQLRYMAGTLIMILIMCRRALPRRDHFGLRLAVGAGVCLALAFCYVPLQYLHGDFLRSHPLAIGPYWLLMNAAMVLFVLFLYDTGLNGALFRVMIASLMENIPTALIRNLFVYTLFPGFPAEHPLWYILLMAGCYGLFFLLADRGLAGKLRSDELASRREDRGTTRLYLFVYLAYTGYLFATKYQMEQSILPMAAYPELHEVYLYLQLFFVSLMVLISVMLTALLWQSYNRVALETEQEVIRHMARERQAQYEFSREHMEMINRKSHDLKHQLQALALASDEERRRQLQEATRAIDFYDAVVKTGNTALDTLLTEKSVYCLNHGIRLSCTVRSQHLEHIQLVDLYTLLGNALDNAIESVEQVNQPEKKIISLSILDQGGMLYLQLENYYEGTLQLKDGLPLTRKADKENHGYGLKSMQQIVRRYGGQMSLHTEGEIFSLEMLLPV